MIMALGRNDNLNPPRHLPHIPFVNTLPFVHTRCTICNMKALVYINDRETNRYTRRKQSYALNRNSYTLHAFSEEGRKQKRIQNLLIKISYVLLYVKLLLS